MVLKANFTFLRHETSICDSSKVYNICGRLIRSCIVFPLSSRYPSNQLFCGYFVRKISRYQKEEICTSSHR